MLDGFGDERVDEQGELLLCWCHFGDRVGTGLAFGARWLSRSSLVRVTLSGTVRLDRECNARVESPRRTLAMCNVQLKVERSCRRGYRTGGGETEVGGSGAGF